MVRTRMVFGTHVVRLFQRDDQPSNNWFMRVYVEGRQFRRSLKTCVLQEARKECQQIMLKIMAKEMAGIKVFSKSLKEVRDGFLLEVKTRESRGELSSETVRYINRRLDLALGSLKSKGCLEVSPIARGFLKSEKIPDSTPVDAVDGKVWQRYIDWRLENTKIRRDVINQELVNIKAMFIWARKQGWCTEKNVPVWNLVLEKQQATREKLTHLEFSRAVQLMRQWARSAQGSRRMLREMVLTVFQTIANSGLRTGECLKLTRGDIQVMDNEIILTIRDSTTKVRKRRQVPILHSGGIWLRDWLRSRGNLLKPDDLVFALGDSKDASIAFYRQFQNLRRDVLKPEGLEKVDAYHARHQWITERLQAGESIHLVAKLAGTSTTQIEKTYSGVIDLVIGREFAKKKLKRNDDGSFEVIKRETSTDLLTALKRSLER
jgi:integrase